jgi:hypothetical protein
MKKFEYLVLFVTLQRCRTAPWRAELNELGGRGWELVSQHKGDFTFKRELPPDPKQRRAIPLGSWDRDGEWHPSPYLKMTEQQQRAYNEKHGFLP